MITRNVLHPKWENPWAGSVGYTFLGRNVIGDGKGEILVDEDLYVLESEMHCNNCVSVSFGARYGNKGNDYSSGEAFYSKKTKLWSISGGASIHTAAAWYFANMHPHRRVYVNTLSREDANPTVKKTGE